MSDLTAGQTALPLPSAELGAGSATTETQWTTTAVSGSVAKGGLLMCRIPGSNILKNRPFYIRAAGRVNGGASGNFTVRIYVGGSTTISSNTKIMDSGAISNGGVKTNWVLEGLCMWDSDGQRITGAFWGNIHGTAVAVTTLSNIITSADLSTEPNLGSATGSSLVLSITGQFATGNSGNTAYVDVFEIMPD
jgi:hypothetical protein